MLELIFVAAGENKLPRNLRTFTHEEIATVMEQNFSLKSKEDAVVVVVSSLRWVIGLGNNNSLFRHQLNSIRSETYFVTTDLPVKPFLLVNIRTRRGMPLI